VIFRQLIHDDLGCASYLIGDQDAGVAAVVDPKLDIEEYLALARYMGVRIEHILETHNHADHVSGHGRLASATGARIHIHRLAEPDYEHEPFDDGWELALGRVIVRALHTPGHRPEHCCYLVEGHVLTGDSLLIGDAARPDLAVDAREGAADLYASLQRLAELPEETEVDPGHVGGSLCATGITSDRSSTIRAELLTNHALNQPDAQTFVALSASISAPRPPTVERVVALNRGPFLGAPPLLEPLDEVRGQLLDVRDVHAYAAGHAHGALNVPVNGSSLGTKAGFLLDAEQPVTLHAASAEQAQQAATQLRAVGLLDLAGYMLELETPEQLRPMGIEELEALVAQDAVEVIDVREKDERDDGYIPGSRHIPYRLVRAYRDELQNGRPLVTVCTTGARAAVAASALAIEGVEARPVLDGGMEDWEARGNTVTAFRRCGGSG
jgi:hydroxyacylglutathione hydrolase